MWASSSACSLSWPHAGEFQGALASLRSLPSHRVSSVSSPSPLSPLSFTFTFTFSHLADAFVQSDVQGIAMGLWILGDLKIQQQKPFLFFPLLTSHTLE